MSLLQLVLVYVLTSYLALGLLLLYLSRRGEELPEGASVGILGWLREWLREVMV